MPRRNVIGEKRGFEQPTHADVNPHLTANLEALRQREGERIVARPINIFEIEPDALQPRRVVPSIARQEATPWDMIQAWWAYAEKDRPQIDLIAFFRGEGDIYSESPSRIEEGFLELVALARSIQREGLTNPISVVHTGDHYRIETGERRWLAYHLLYGIEGARWEKIPARIMDDIDVWRQAAENNARANLNAIGKARQYAILVMDIHTQRGEQFYTADRFTHERDFYAQVLRFDSVPYGTRDMILAAMALKSPAELTRCRSLLELPASVWTLADDFSVPQSVLLRAAAMSEPDALKYIENVSGWEDPGDQSPTPPGKPSRVDVENPVISREQVKKIGRFMRLASRVGWEDLEKLEDKTRRDLLKTADELEALVQKIRSNLH